MRIGIRIGAALGEHLGLAADGVVRVVRLGAVERWVLGVGLVSLFLLKLSDIARNDDATVQMPQKLDGNTNDPTNEIRSILEVLKECLASIDLLLVVLYSIGKVGTLAFLCSLLQFPFLSEDNDQDDPSNGQDEVKEPQEPKGFAVDRNETSFADDGTNEPE